MTFMTATDLDLYYIIYRVDNVHQDHALIVVNILGFKR